MAILQVVPFWQSEAQVIDSASPLFESPIAPDTLLHPQTWSFEQDSEGLIYVGHSQGIAVYDGTLWSDVKLPRKNVARSLLVRNDTLFVGLKGEFGYILLDRVDERYHSLSNSLKEFEKDENVWAVHAVDNSIVFQTRNNLHLLVDDQITSISTETGFHTSFVVAGRLFVREQRKGLMELVDGRLEEAPNGAFFANTRIYFMVAGDQGEIIIGTRDRGLFRYVGKKLTQIDGTADSILRSSQVYYGVRLSNGRIAVATLDNGVFTTSMEGDLKDRIQTEDQVINTLFEDGAEGLWIGTHNDGPKRVDHTSPYLIYSSVDLNKGTVYDIARYDENLLVATGGGLWIVADAELSTPQSIEASRFSRALGVWAGGFVIGLESGLYFSGLHATDSTFGIVNDLAYGENNDLIVATRDGLYSAQRETGSQRNLILPGDFRAAETDPNGRIFAINAEHRLYSVLGDVRDDISLARIDTVSTRFRLKLIDGQAVVFSESKVISATHLDSNGITLQDHPAFKPNAFSSTQLLDLAQHPDGSVWAVTTDQVLVSSKDSSGTYSTKRHPYLSFKRGRVSRIFFDKDDVVWISDGSELVRFDAKIDKTYEARFPALVRKVTISQTDSVIFAGSAYASSEGLPKLRFEDNDLSFEFASPEFNKPEETVFQYKLEGRSDSWSDWARSTSVDFNNLREGDYRFVVRSKNFLGYVSPEGEFSFTILPPWYRTWWAYCLVSLTLLICSFLALKYYHMLAANKRAQEQARELARERIVNERLQEANAQLQVANSRLQEVNALKDEFLANTSHELRTPITAIIGYSAVLKEELSGSQRQFVEVIESSSQRLMHTLNMVLDLAQLRSGTVELVPVELNLFEEVENIIQEKKLNWHKSEAELVTSTSSPNATVSIDRYALNTIVENLVDNAFKFTPEGKITVTVNTVADRAVLRIADEGIGMEESFIPHIFEEFRQESDGVARTFEGNGLGLAVTARMVEISGGTIEVESTKDVGSTFTVILPLVKKRDIETTDRPAIAHGSDDSTESVTTTSNTQRTTDE